MLRTHGCALLPLAAVAFPSAAEPYTDAEPSTDRNPVVRVVNDAGTADFQYRTIQAAIDAALDGDTILVQSGTYGGFVLAQRSLTIVSELGAQLRFVPLAEVVIDGLAVNRHVVLRGLEALPGERSPRLVIRNAAGPILIEDSRFESTRMDIEAAHIQDADAVFLIDVDLIGGTSALAEAHGLSAERSSIYVYGGSVSSGFQIGTEMTCETRDGVSGMRLASSHAFLSGVTIDGGDAYPCPGPILQLGDGGPGLELVESIAESLGARIVGGLGSGDNFFCAMTQPGPPVLADAASSYTVLPGTAHSLRLPAPLREGTAVQIQLFGEPGEDVFLHGSSRLALPAFHPGFVGPLLTLAPDEIRPLGLTSTGVKGAVITIGSLPPRQQVAAAFVQGVFLGSLSNFTSNPSAAIVLASEITPIEDDCDNNGKDDVLDIAAGTLMDCDANGVPDRCDIAAGAVPDCNANGWPDTCERTTEELVAFVPSHASSRRRFGTDVALEGGTLIASENRGTVLVFEQDALGRWPVSETAELVPSIPPTGTSFMGGGVALAGDTLAVGMMISASVGLVFVFERIDGVWMETAVLSPDMPQNDGRFGERIALDRSGDLMVVNSFASQRVFVFRRDMTGAWHQEAIFTSPGYSGLAFGASVDTDGETIVIGAPWATGACQMEGAVFVYDYDGQGWTETARLTSTLAREGDEFGSSVALNDSTLAVSAPFAKRSGLASGDVFVFEREVTGWEPAGSLGLEPIAFHALTSFGTELDLDGDTLVALSEGSLHGVHVFERNPIGGWSYRSSLSPSTPPRGVTAVAIDGSFVAHSYARDPTYGFDAGRVFLYVEADCNENEVPDDCDLRRRGADLNENDVLDACER